MSEKEWAEYMRVLEAQQGQQPVHLCWVLVRENRSAIPRGHRFIKPLWQKA